MNNVAHLAAHRDKRAGKAEAFEVIRNAKPGAPLNAVDLATLYSYFLPAPTRKITSVFEWVSLPCDLGSTYAFAKFVRVSDGMTQAANTKAAHISFGTEMPDGWYDVQRGAAGEDVAIMPDILGALAEASGESVSFNPADAQVVDTPTGLSYVLPWCNLGVNRGYFDSLFRPLEDPIISTGKNSAFSVSGTVSGTPVCAVIMPFELPPMEEL